MGQPSGTTQARLFGGWASGVDGPFTKQGWATGLTRISAGCAVVRPKVGGGLPRTGHIRTDPRGEVVNTFHPFPDSHLSTPGNRHSAP
jgi:hypothetical protein